MSVSAICQIAERLLAEDPDPVVRLRLLRDAIQRPTDSQEVTQAGALVAQSRWVRVLEQEQWDDGSWGRLHSQDHGAGQKIPTTEAGVGRALALGLEAAHPILRKASQHLVEILEGRTEPRDRAEKNDRWSTGVQLFAASTLAQLEPDLPLLDGVWDLWLEIARRTFASGSYDPDAEARAHRELTGASVKDSYLVIDNKYTLALLGSRSESLPRDLEATLLNWLWHKGDGVRYLGAAMSPPPQRGRAGPLERWFMSSELLSLFPSWRRLAGDTIQWLWQQQTAQGYWDLGPRPAFCIALPLSENWRRKLARQFDWTTRVLVLLRRYHAQGNT